jgi:hypothetical protein
MYLKQAHAIFNDHPNCGPAHPYTLQAAAQLKKLAPHVSTLETKAQQCIHSQHTSDQAFSGSWAQAIIAFQEGLEKNQRFFGEQFYANIALSHWCLSSCYLQQENYTQALGHVEKSYTLRLALFGESAELTQKTKERINLCREKLVNSTSQPSMVRLKLQESNNIATSAGSITKNYDHFYRPSSPATSASASEEESHRPK